MFLGKFRGTCPSGYSEEPVPRNIPRDMFLGIFRGTCPSVKSDENSEEHFVGGNIPTKFSLGIFRGDFRQTSDPRNFLGNLFPRNSVGKF
uniref:Uncharacterized protein n=1 Tax=Brassica oleracea var. oleracea TaxID=109376 RepID=A0A0D3EB07_BRAOL